MITAVLTVFKVLSLVILDDYYHLWIVVLGFPCIDVVFGFLLKSKIIRKNMWYIIDAVLEIIIVSVWVGIYFFPDNIFSFFVFLLMFMWWPIINIGGLVIRKTKTASIKNNKILFMFLLLLACYIVVIVLSNVI